MKISEASKQSGLPAKTIRYYESIGLFKGLRDQNGYRNYSESDVQQMHFLQRSRQLGFSLDECRGLLSLHKNPHRASSEVKLLAQTRLDQIDEQIRQLQLMKSTLNDLVKQCPGDAGADCVILDELSK